MEIVKIIQLISAIVLMVAILLQNRGGGLSNVFGGIGSNIYLTKRGFEKKLFVITIVIAAVFISASLVSIIL